MNDVKVRILGISGTPVKDGNSDQVVKAALEAAALVGNVETEFVTLADKDIPACIHCQHCIENKVPCKFVDDSNQIIEQMLLADGMIWGAPVWTHTIPPQLINLMSRCRYYCFYTGDFHNKVMGSVTVSWFGVGEEFALMTMDSMAQNYMIIPVFRGWAKVSKAAFGQRPDYLDNGALADTGGMVRVRLVGQRVAEIAKKIKYASLAGVGIPEEEERSITCGRYPLHGLRAANLGPS